jgi:2-iminobutanoate/2-iminopropanoate deaminase
MTGRRTKGGIRRIVLDEGVSPPSGPYSHAVVAGGFVFVSGQGSKDPATGRFVGSEIAAQTRQTLRNIRTILNHVNLDLTDVVKVNAYLSNIKDFRGFNEAYDGLLGDARPARTTVQATLPSAEMLVEIDVVAKARV